MAVSRETAEGLAEQVASIYGHAELQLLRLLADALASGVDSPTWAVDRLAQLQMLRRHAGRIINAAELDAARELATAVETAYLRGLVAGEQDLSALGRIIDAPPPIAGDEVATMVAAQHQAFRSLGPAIVRQVADGYRTAVVQAAAGVLEGRDTRLKAAQHALDGLASRGLSGFTDARGRRWDTRAYVEMATRSVTAQAAVTAHMDRLEQGGIDLFIVSDSPRECDICAPWEGKILSRNGLPTVTRDAVTGKSVRVDVAATVAEATSKGLFHPNCTHNLSGYIPGATRAGEATSSPEGYAERQELRRLERGVREWKRRQAVAVTPEAKAKADGKVREWQARIGEHVEATGLPRKRNRESLTAAL